MPTANPETNVEDASPAIRKKMVLLSMPRTGSTMMTRKLTQHDNAHMLNAIFSDRGWGHGGRVHRSLKEGLDERWEDLAYRVENRAQLLDKIFDLDAAPCMGFKHHLSGPREITKTVLEDDSIAKIILNRTNLLACYSSNKLAVLHRSLGPDAEKPRQVEFDAEEFKAYVKRRKHAYSRWDEIIDANADNCLRITYAEARTDAGMDKVTTFLGLSSSKLDSPTKKRNSDEVLTRFTNPDDAAACLREEGLEDWATEKPAGE
jgi:hypothetical protein